MRCRTHAPCATRDPIPQQLRGLNDSELLGQPTRRLKCAAPVKNMWKVFAATAPTGLYLRTIAWNEFDFHSRAAVNAAANAVRTFALRNRFYRKIIGRRGIGLRRAPDQTTRGYSPSFSFCLPPSCLSLA